MTPRSVETALSWFTLAMLCIYVPVETWASLPGGLLNPFFLVDAFAIVLLFVGAMLSLRARPKPAPFLLCAAYGWTAANAWRGAFGRIDHVQSGGELPYGQAELFFVVVGGAIMIICFAISVFLVLRATGTQAGGSSP